MFKRYIAPLLAAWKQPQQLAELSRGVVPIRWGVRLPAVSDKFGRFKRRGRGHLGVDLMFRRHTSGQERRPGKSKHYECPTGEVRALCCSDGRVVRIVDSEDNGGAIYVDHGRYLSVYRHLDLAHKDLWPELGAPINMADKLGIVGHAPSAGAKGINHLHFEIWDTDRKHLSRWDRAGQAINPGPFIKQWAG